MVTLFDSKYKDLFKIIGQTADTLGYECYVIGGYVRDFFLGKENDDLDFVVVGNGIAMAKAVAQVLNAKKFDYYESYGTAKVTYNNIDLEFVGARKEFYHRESRNPIVEDGTLKDDMDRRDLTINDMAFCINVSRFGELIDPYNGLDDLQNKRIITPLDPNITFSDDPLRMLRAIRFAARFDFTISDNTFKAICDNKDRLSIITKERITEELRKMISGNNPVVALELLHSSGILKIVLPEVAALSGVTRKGVKQVGHKDIFKHTLEVLNNVAQQTSDEWIRWAALLHDIGKPIVKKWVPDNNGNGIWTFYDHAAAGVAIVEKIFKRLGLPTDARMELVKKLVNFHMHPTNLCNETVTDSAVRRLLFNLGEDIDKLMIICNADITTGNACKKKAFRDNYELLKQRMVQIEESDKLRNFKMAFNGDDICELFNLTPSKEVGILKGKLKDAILDGVIPNTKEASKQYLLDITLNNKKTWIYQ